MATFGQDPQLAFIGNLVESFRQAKALRFQEKLFERREQRFETQLQENRLHRQRQMEFRASDPKRALAGIELETVRDATPEQKRALFTRGTTVNISAGEREKTATGLATLDVLGNLKKLFDSPDTRTGPVVGRIDPRIGQIGLTSRNQEDFMAATSAFKNQIIKEITGAQMSEVEAVRIMKQVPDITDHPDRWEAKWRQSVQNIQFLQRRRQQIQGGVTPDPFVLPSESQFGPENRPVFRQKEINLNEIDPADLEGLFK